MIRICLICLALLLITPYTTHAAQETATIAAIVGPQAITTTQITDRVRLFMASAGLSNHANIMAQVRKQALDSLINEALQRQEAHRLDIEVPPEKVDAAFAAIAAQNKLSADQFRTAIAHQGIPLQTLKDRITAQIAWSGVVDKEVLPRIVVAQVDIDAALAKIAASIGQAQYRIAEIFLPIDQGRPEEDMQKLASTLAAEIRTGKTTFGKTAQQFSQSTNADKGGDLGWLGVTQMPDYMAPAVLTLSPKGVSAPVRAPQGYYLYWLEEKNTAAKKGLPSRDAVAEALLRERLDRAQYRYLLDLRARSFVDIRK